MIVQNRHTALVSAFLVLLLSVMTVSLTSCKKDSWLDWKAQNAAFLVRNMQKDSIVTTPSGLQYKVIRQGIQGTKPDELKHVRIRYKGSLITGNVFDQSDDASFAVSSVVEGLKEGLKKMNKSGHYIFYIPHSSLKSNYTTFISTFRNAYPYYTYTYISSAIIDTCCMPVPFSSVRKSQQSRT